MHHRHSIRLKGYDYSQEGSYFITIVCQDRADRFGEIVDGVMILNDAGKMVESVWNEIPNFYPGASIDSHVVMPNHFHGIIIINNHVGAALRGCPNQSEMPKQNETLDVTESGNANETLELTSLPDPGQARGPAHTGPGQARGPAHTGLGQARGPARTTAISMWDVVHRFKSFTTHRYSNGVKIGLVKPFRKRLWQRNYWEHIIRDEREHFLIREYIQNNPGRWEADCFCDPTDDNELHEPPAEYHTNICNDCESHAINNWTEIE